MDANNITVYFENFENSNRSLFMGLFLLISILIIVLNIPSVLIVFTAMTKRINVYNAQVLLCLSVTDLIFGLFFLSFNIINSTKSTFTYKECAVLLFGMLTSSLSSHCQILGIAIERCVAIKRKVNWNSTALANKKFSSKMLLILPWSVSIVFVLMMYMVYLNSVKGDNSMCVLHEFSPGVYTTIGVVSIAIQISTWIFLSRTIYFLVRHLKQCPIQTQGGKREIRTAVTFIIIAIVWTILIFPHLVVQCFGSLMGGVSQTTRSVLAVLPILTCVINPILYLIRIKRLRYLMLTSIVSLCCKTKIAPLNSQCRNHVVGFRRRDMVAQIYIVP